MGSAVLFTFIAIFGSPAHADEAVDMKYCVEYINANSDLKKFLPLTSEGKIDAAKRASLVGLGDVSQWKEVADRKAAKESISVEVPSTDTELLVQKEISASFEKGSITKIVLKTTLSTMASMPGHGPGVMPGYGPRMGTAMSSTSTLTLLFKVINNKCVPYQETNLLNGSNMEMMPRMGPAFYSDISNHETFSLVRCRKLKVANDQGLTAENFGNSTVAGDFPTSQPYPFGGAIKISPAQRLQMAQIELGRCQNRAGASAALEDEKLWKGVELKSEEASAPADTGR